MRRIKGQKEAIQSKKNLNILFVMIFVLSILAIIGLILFSIFY